MSDLTYAEGATGPAKETGGARSANSMKEVLEEAQKRYEKAFDEDSDNRNNSREDFHFVFTKGWQWDDKTKAQRTKWKEPCLEFNQLKQFVHQVVNDQRQNRPGIRVHPASGPASKETGEIIQGMVRNIQYDSSAESVYDTGYECSVVGGRGWWRICSEYESETSFDQKIVIKAIKDPNTVIADNNYDFPDGRDRGFVFVLEKIAKDEFAKRWPKATAIDFESIDTRWGDSDSVIVADYYRREMTERTLVMMSDGAVGWKDELPDYIPPGITEVATREVETYRIEWFKIAGGQQILKEYDCPGEYIPVICTTGDDVLIDGERVFQGLISDAKDPQRMLNYGMTQQAVHLAMTPRAPWVIAAGQVDKYKDIWKNANRENYAYLPYDPITIDGLSVAPPQRTAPSMPDAGWLNWTQQQLGMIKSTIGMYENSLGIRGNEQSGVAITARERQGDNATYHFADNLSRAIALTGIIIVSWIPYYYDTERIVHIVGLDNTRKQITINQMSPDPSGETDEAGALKHIKMNDVTVGKYAITVEAGPSFATKRQESAAKLGDLVKAYPPLMQVAGDIVVRAQDIPDADALADRIRLMLPPAVQQSIAAEEQGQRAPDPKILQAMAQKDAQLGQAKQMMAELHQKLQKAESGVALKVQTAVMEEQAAERDAQRKAAQAQQQAALDAKIAIDKVNAEARVKIQTAHINAQTAIEEAMIKRSTELDIAKMNQQTDITVAGMETEAVGETSEGEQA